MPKGYKFWNWYGEYKKNVPETDGFTVAHAGPKTMKIMNGREL